MIHVAVSQFHIELIPSWDDYCVKMTRHVTQAVASGAQLLVLPEYAGVEVYGQYEETDRKLFESIQPLLSRYIEFFQTLATNHQLYIQPGSILVKANTGRFYNRAYLFGPRGEYGFQDKIRIVADEKEEDLLECGKKQTLFDTALGFVGIAICYDSEFPELVRNFTRQGAKLIIVPSFTPSNESFQRVFYSCQARAIENQCYVIVASAIGTTRIGDTNYCLEGQANIFSPIDSGFPSGVVNQGNKNEACLVHAQLDFNKLEQVRKHGQVHNFDDFMNMDTRTLSLATLRLE